jgi:hypothetical protein
MRIALKTFAWLAGCVWMTGCLVPAPWPGKAETSPAIRGHIADARTKQPVVGARVQIYERPETATVSDAAGDFQLAPGRQFYLMRFFSPGDVYYIPSVRDKSFAVEIVHTNYQPLCLDAFWQWQHWDSRSTNQVPAEIVIRDALLAPKGN